VNNVRPKKMATRSNRIQSLSCWSNICQVRADNANLGKHTCAFQGSRPNALDFGGLPRYGGDLRCSVCLRRRSANLLIPAALFLVFGLACTQTTDLRRDPARYADLTASAIVPLAASYEPDQERYNAMRDTVPKAVSQDRQRPAAIDPIHIQVKQGRIIDAVAMLHIRDRLDLTTASARVDEIRNARLLIICCDSRLQQALALRCGQTTR
jgi:hypothetical protein